MTIMGGLSCHIMRQKSTRVPGSGPAWREKNITLKFTAISYSGLQTNSLSYS